VKNLDKFYSYWQKTLERYGKYFKDPTFLFQIQELSFKPSYLIDRNRRQENEKYEISGSESNSTIDQLDHQILKMIASDARLPLIEIVKKLNTSSNVVRYRLRKLRKLNVIQGFRTNIDITKLGYISIKADIFLNKFEDRLKIINHLRYNPYVVCIMKSFGYSHIEIELNTKDINHFYEIMKDLINSFPDVINSYHYFTILENHKLCWMP
jgi:Lrp/AsnC family transcriptional regulator for asnA, asnC and gidA